MRAIDSIREQFHQTYHGARTDIHDDNERSQQRREEWRPLRHPCDSAGGYLQLMRQVAEECEPSRALPVYALEPYHVHDASNEDRRFVEPFDWRYSLPVSVAALWSSHIESALSSTRETCVIRGAISTEGRERRAAINDLKASYAEISPRLSAIESIMGGFSSKEETEASITRSIGHLATKESVFCLETRATSTDNSTNELRNRITRLEEQTTELSEALKGQAVTLAASEERLRALGEAMAAQVLPDDIVRMPAFGIIGEKVDKLEVTAADLVIIVETLEDGLQRRLAAVEREVRDLREYFDQIIDGGVL